MREKRILSVTVYRETDENPDTSYMGEYTDNTSDPWSIVRETGRFLADYGEEETLPSKGREMRFFIPYGGGEEKGSATFREYGMQDFQRMERLCRGDWGFIGIFIVARVQLASDIVQNIRSGGLWGIESDSEEGDLLSIEKEECADLARELKAIGFSAGQVTRAIRERVRHE